MTYPGLEPRFRAIAATCFRTVRQRLNYVRQQEQALPPRSERPRRNFREEMIARTVERVRRETKLELRSMRRLLHEMFG
jgi:hypothetical protein